MRSIVAVSDDFLDPREHIEGKYYIDIYNVDSGQRVLALQGSFHGEDPYYVLRSGAWVSKNYFYLQLDTKNLRRFVICDMRRATATDNGPEHRPVLQGHP